MKKIKSSIIISVNKVEISENQDFVFPLIEGNLPESEVMSNCLGKKC